MYVCLHKVKKYVSQTEEKTRREHRSCIVEIHLARVNLRGRPFANAANSYVEFPACMSQKFGHWANIQPLS
jgi:hypothetical protein